MSDQPEAGWYDDPDVPGGLRWWDGTQWSDHREPPAGSTGSDDGDTPAAVPTPGESDPAVEDDPTAADGTPDEDPAPEVEQAAPEPVATRPLVAPGAGPAAPPRPVAAQRRPDAPAVAVPPPRPTGQWAPPGQGWGPAPAAVAWQPVAPRRVDGRAATSLILSLLWLFGLGSLVAIPLGILGLRAIPSGDEGRGMAIAGIAIGALGLAAGIWLVAVLSG